MSRQFAWKTSAAALALVTASGLAQMATEPALRHTAEFRASTYAPSAQEAPAISVAPDGSFAVVCASIGCLPGWRCKVGIETDDCSDSPVGRVEE